MNWFNPRKRYGLEFHLFIVQKSPPTIEYVHSDPDGDGGRMPRDISSITGTVPGPGRDLAHFRTTATMEVWRCTREVLDREAWPEHDLSSLELFFVPAVPIFFSCGSPGRGHREFVAQYCVVWHLIAVGTWQLEWLGSFSFFVVQFWSTMDSIRYKRWDLLAVFSGTLFCDTVIVDFFGKSSNWSLFDCNQSVTHWKWNMAMLLLDSNCMFCEVC